MPFNFTCPHCKKELEAENDWEGLEAECPLCSKPVTIKKPRNLKLPEKMLSPSIELSAIQEGNIDTEYGVSFQREALIRCNGKKLHLSGSGRLSFVGGAIQIEVTPFLNLGRKKIYVFQLSYIKNVAVIDKKIQFSVFSEDKSSEQDSKIVILEVKDANAAHQLEELLPKEMSPAFKQEYSVHFQFYMNLNTRTPNVIISKILIAANIIVFLLMLVLSSGESFLNPSSEFLVKAGANFAPLTTAGEWWRLVTCIFIHNDFFHLLFNMLAFLYVTVLVERLYGNIPFAIVYFGAGILGGLASLYYYPNTFSVGASGAIFGVYGALLAYFFKYRNVIPVNIYKDIFWSTLFFVGYNLLNGIKSVRIDNAAHIGGFLGGFVLGWLAAIPLSWDEKASDPVKPALIKTTLVFIGIAILSGVFLSERTARFQQWQNFKENFIRIESENVNAYNALLNKANTEKISDEDFLSVLETDILPKWKSIARQGQQISAQNIPAKKEHEVMMDITTRWIEFCEKFIRAVHSSDKTLMNEAINARKDLEAYLTSLKKK